MKLSAFASALTLALVACSDDQHAHTSAVEATSQSSAVTAESIQVDAQAPVSITRPAAKPASPKEWKALQDYVSAQNAISRKESQAHDALMASLTKGYRHQDVDAIAEAMERYQKVLEVYAEQSGNLELPDISDINTTRYLRAATDAFAEKDFIEAEKNSALLGGINGTRTQLTEDEVQKLTQEENLAALKSVLAFQLVYQNYGYSADDIDEATYRIKPKARPQATVSLIERFDTKKRSD